MGERALTSRLYRLIGGAVEFSLRPITGVSLPFADVRSRKKLTLTLFALRRPSKRTDVERGRRSCEAATCSLCSAAPRSSPNVRSYAQFIFHRQTHGTQSIFQL